MGWDVCASKVLWSTSDGAALYGMYVQRKVCGMLPELKPGLSQTRISLSCMRLGELVHSFVSVQVLVFVPLKCLKTVVQS